MDDNAIEVKYIDDQHFLKLGCGSLAFARFKDLVRAEAKLSDAEFERTSTIVIVDMSDMTNNRPAQKTRIRERIALWGCGLVVVLLLIVFGAGIQTIWRWLTAP